jgi:cytochrome P450
MRLFPPAWTIGRRAIQDYAVDGYLLPAGSLILVSPYVTQRDKRYFPEPNLFDPDRWSGAPASARQSFSYFPFSGGPRGCLGEHLAWMELVLLVATLRQRGRLRLVPDHALALRPLIALRPKGGMRMRWERRSAANTAC